MSAAASKQEHGPVAASFAGRGFAEIGARAGYRHARGIHCGSTALRNLLAARGLELSEALVFGLGAGLGFSLHDGARGLVPPLPERFFVGRSLSFEEDLCAAIGAQLEVLRFESPQAAWSDARARIARGQGPLAYVDLMELPYLGAHGHWYGHLIALAGALGAGERESVLVGDNERAELQEVPLPAMLAAFSAASPAPSDEKVLLAIGGVHALSAAELREACARALWLQGRRLRDSSPRDLQVWRGAPALGFLAGEPALRAFPDEIRAWAGAADLARRLKFGAQVIEVRGNGGGLFRRLYATFLEEAAALGVAQAAPLIPLCLRAADAFTALAVELERLRAQAQSADGLHANDLELQGAAALAAQVRDAELALWAGLPAA